MANMKSKCLPLALSLVFVFSIAQVPAYGANRDIVQLQTEVDQLQQAMTQMKQSFDERMGVMKNLLEQNTDSANKVTAAITGLQASLNKQQQASGGQVDQISGQIQALNDTMDELKVRLAKLSKQLEDLQAAQQSLAAQQSQTQQQTQAMAAAPPPDVLYNNALRDFNGGNNDVAGKEFSDYIKFYPDTDLAGNAYFYLAEMEYKAGDYQNGGRELRSRHAELSQRKQSCLGSVEERFRADRTGTATGWHPGTEARNSALPANHRGDASPRQTAQAGGGAQNPLKRVSKMPFGSDDASLGG